MRFSAVVFASLALVAAEALASSAPHQRMMKKRQSDIYGQPTQPTYQKRKHPHPMTYNPAHPVPCEYSADGYLTNASVPNCPYQVHPSHPTVPSGNTNGTTSGTDVYGQPTTPMNNTSTPPNNPPTSPPALNPPMNNTSHPPMNNTSHPPMNNTSHPPMNNTSHPPMNSTTGKNSSGSDIYGKPSNGTMTPVPVPVTPPTTPKVPVTPPTVPKVPVTPPTTPKVPAVTIPKVPDVPKVPAVTIPKVPDVPKVPAVTPPKVPDVPKVPAVTPPTTPKVPAVTPPKVPDVPKVPAVTPPTTPKVPAVTPPKTPNTPTTPSKDTPKCDPSGGAVASLLQLNVANCNDICVLSKCPKKTMECKTTDSKGNPIVVKAVNCNNINILSQVGGSSK